MGDSTRWYDPNTLEVVEQTPSADGKKLVKADIRHARKLNLLPSVTTIEKHIYGLGQGVVDYKMKAMAQAVATNPPNAEDFNDDGTLTKEYLKRMFDIADILTAEARDKGTVIHGWIARFLERSIAPTEPIGIDIVNRVSEMMIAIDAKDVSCEKALGGREFGWCGTPDRYVGSANLAKMQAYCGAGVTFGPDVMGEIIFDTKTQEWKKKPTAYDSMKRQFGGYGILTDIGEDSLYVQEYIHRVTGEVVWKCYEDVAEWKTHFASGFEQWVTIKKYDPREK